MPLAPSATLHEEYGLRHRTGVEAIRSGDFRTALEEFTAAEAISCEIGEPALQHEARANLSMVYIQMGEDRKAEAGLREILLNSREPRVRFGAAYNLAVSLRKQGRYGRARVYAQSAMDSALRVREASARAGCHNLIGNILMNQSMLDEALVEYRNALTIRRRQKGDVRYSIAIVLENIGYVWILKKRHRRGIGLILRALAIQTELGARRYICECYQDLCFAHMQLCEYGEATEFGDQALALARENGYRDIEKNCYYLLGETAHLAGRSEDRDRHFDRLQNLHPELPFLKDFLCAYDLSEILTLKR